MPLHITDTSKDPNFLFIKQVIWEVTIKNHFSHYFQVQHNRPLLTEHVLKEVLFPCCLLNCECSWKKTQVEKKLRSFITKQVYGVYSKWMSCYDQTLHQIQSNLYKTISFGATQKWSSWASGHLMKLLYKTVTKHMLSFVAGFYFFSPR